MYAIHAEYFFYAGTLNAPKSGVIAAYPTRAEAEKVLAHLTGGERYYLRHGEYAAPAYKIVKRAKVGAHVVDYSRELAADATLYARL